MDAREPTRMNLSEAPNLMVAPNPYGGGGGVPSSSMMIQNSPSMIRLINIPSASKPMGGSSPMYNDGIPGMRSCVNMGEPMKKKRGRPRKYGGADGSMALALSPISSSSPSGYRNPNGSPLSDPITKRRGRPPGSGKKQQLDALGSAGIAFTPHVITVKAGEDVASKIMAFSQQGPRTVCILSANGAICKCHTSPTSNIWWNSNI